MGIKKFSNLYNKFNELLLEKDIIECDIGLYQIIEEMLAATKIYQDANLGTSSLIPVVFNSINTKHGCLLVDYCGGDEVVQHIVNFTEKISYKTCEMCGNIGQLYCSSKWTKWSNKKTLCHKHAVELFYYQIT